MCANIACTSKYVAMQAFSRNEGKSVQKKPAANTSGTSSILKQAMRGMLDPCFITSLFSLWLHLITNTIIQMLLCFLASNTLRSQMMKRGLQMESRLDMQRVMKKKRHWNHLL